MEQAYFLSFPHFILICLTKLQGSEHGRNGRIGRIGTDLWTYLKKWTYPSIRPCVMDVWDGYGRIRP